jgi:ceramide glucosyltransferase
MLTGAPRVGCTFAPVVVGGIRTAGDVGYAMLLNALYGPAAASAAGEGCELPFIMGQIMVFNREALAAIGGVGCAAGQLVDDMYIGKRVAKAGYSNVMIAHPLRIVTGGLSFEAFLKVYRRWIMFSRNGLPFAFTWPLWGIAIGFFASLPILGFALAAGQLPAAALSAATLAVQGLSIESLQRRFGGGRTPLRYAWMPWAIFLLAPFVVASMARRDLGWRGRTYQLALTTRLRASRELETSRSWPSLTGQLAVALDLVQRARQRWNDRRPGLR